VSDGGTPSAGQPGPAWRTRKWSLALGVIAVVFVVLAGYDLIAGGALRSGPAASSATRSPSPKATAGSALAAAPVTAPSSLGSAAPSSPAPSSAASPAEALTVASAAAFGPSGTSDGDNPGLAPRGVGGGAWYSSWYTTPEFGELKAGTGILLDMGQPVTVKSVGLVLGSAVGADVEVRVGDTAILSGHVPGGERVRRRRNGARATAVAGERAVRADLVHPAAAELARHVPGERLQRDGGRPPVRRFGGGCAWWLGAVPANSAVMAPRQRLSACVGCRVARRLNTLRGYLTAGVS
jgi:hypothetical protein